MIRKPVVSSLSMAFRKATNLKDDIEEVKKEHRTNLKTLMDTYMADVQSGKAEGIRTARELVELIKTDMLLLGEATERTEELNAVDQLKIDRLTKVLDEDDPEVQAIMNSMFNALNGANDDYDKIGNKQVSEQLEKSQTATEQPIGEENSDECK